MSFLAFGSIEAAQVVTTILVGGTVAFLILDLAGHWDRTGDRSVQNSAWSREHYLEERESGANPWRLLLIGTNHSQHGNRANNSELESMHAWLWDELAFLENASMPVFMQIRETSEFSHLKRLFDECAHREIQPRQWYHAYADAIEVASRIAGQPVLVPNQIPRDRLLPDEWFQPPKHMQPGKDSKSRTVVPLLVVCAFMVFPFVLYLRMPDHLVVQMMAAMWGLGLVLGIAWLLGYGYMGMLGARFHSIAARYIANGLSFAACIGFGFALVKIVFRGLDDAKFADMELGFIAASASHFVALAVSKSRRWRRVFR